jgi:hypothetical protein
MFISVNKSIYTRRRNTGVSITSNHSNNDRSGCNNDRSGYNNDRSGYKSKNNRRLNALKNV